MRAAASRTFWTAGRSRPIRIAMIAITTNSSISVKPRRRDGRSIGPSLCSKRVRDNALERDRYHKTGRNALPDTTPAIPRPGAAADRDALVIGILAEILAENKHEIGALRPLWCNVSP